MILIKIEDTIAITHEEVLIFKKGIYNLGNPKNTISLNGKIYDVASGTLVNKLPALTKKHWAKSKTKKSDRSNKVVDGFTAPKSTPAQAKQTIKPKHHVRRSIRHITPRKLDRPKTLMRGLVRKPNPHDKPKVHKVSSPLKPAKADDRPATSSDRIKRAAIIKRSKHVVRFAPPGSNIIKKTMPLMVKSPSQHKSVKKQKPTITETTKSFKSDVRALTKPAGNLFSRGVERATSHEQILADKPKKTRALIRKLKLEKRSSKIAFTVIISLIVFGALFWNFLPNIQIKIASVRAGFSATLPSYTPAGYSRQAIEYSKGEVSVIYKSNSDDREFSLVQTVSSWSSESLADNYVKTKAKQYQTVEEQGKTIYTFDDSNATWVNGGVWYKISSNDNLNNEQLLKIADSL